MSKQKQIPKPAAAPTDVQAAVEKVLAEAVAVLQRIASERVSEVGPHALRDWADRWLLAYGYESGEALREKAEKRRRLEHIGYEIARLEAERETLK